MNNLIFSINATMPIFFVMVIGYLLHQIGWIDDVFAAKMNKFVFLVPLPVLLFLQLAETDFRSVWDTKFVLFCFGATLLSIVIAFLISFILPSIPERGEFIQGAYRSSAAILGMAYIENIYGDATIGPLMIIGAVPLYNVMAVVILVLSSENSKGLDAETVRRTLKNVITNPIIIGIFAGLLWSLLNIPMPYLLSQTMGNLSKTATPLGLLALGASIDPKKVSGELKPAVLATFIKLVGLELLFLPLAVHLGFRQEKLVAIMIMLGSPTTVTSFVMAKNMGHEGTLSSNTVVLATVLSAFTLTAWVYITKSMGLI